MTPPELPTETPVRTTTTTCISAPASAEVEKLVIPRQLLDRDRLGIIELLQKVPAGDAQILMDELAAALEVSGTIKTTPGRWFYGLLQKYVRGQFNPIGAHVVAARRAAPVETVKPERKPASPEVAEAHLAEIAAGLQMSYNVGSGRD